MMDEIFARFWGNLGDRVGGPLTFRLIIQPIVAIVLAVVAGLKDAKEKRPAYFWALVSDPIHRRSLIQEGWKAVAKVFVLAILIDAIYQWKVLHFFYPGEALVIAVLLAFVPYLLVRGPVNRLAQRCRKDKVQ